MKTDFEAKIEKKAERFRNNTYQALESEVARKRISWIKQNYRDDGNNDRPSPRKAFELLFFKYMGLSEMVVPVLSETEEEIVWSSVNKCPTLAACNKLGLDTRKVCRGVYEKSTQAFLSQLDPQLRFHRSYEEIRPHSHHCKEMIIRIDFEQMMEIAIEEAKRSRSEGNEGYGAVVVYGSQIPAKAHDTAITGNDPSRHAEVKAIRQAAQALGDSNLCGCVLFSTHEPCTVCTSIAVQANLTTIVYGVSQEESVRHGKSRIQIQAREAVDRSPAMLEVIGGVLAEKCKAL